MIGKWKQKLPREFYGPQLGRPYADTLKGSKHANMKELRFEASAVSTLYRQAIAKADKRFSAHLDRLRAGKKER